MLASKVQTDLAFIDNYALELVPDLSWRVLDHVNVLFMINDADHARTREFLDVLDGCPFREQMDTDELLISSTLDELSAKESAKLGRPSFLHAFGTDHQATLVRKDEHEESDGDPRLAQTHIEG